MGSVPHRPWIGLLVAGLASLCVFEAAWALPRYSTQYAQSCHLCHHNPGGGGMRTAYGAQFFTGTEMAARGLAQEQLDLLSPALGERLEIGLDFRGLVYQETQSGNPATSLGKHDAGSFLLMQGDVYLAFKLHDKARVVLEKALRGEGEGYALLDVLPGHGNLKAGRFLPNHGWRWADHETATRRALGFSAGQADTGVELEFHPDQYSLSLAVTNDAAGLQDGNRGKALTARVLWQGEVLGGPVALGAGGRVSDRAPAPSRTLAGIFWGLSRGPLTWTAQVDRFEEDTTTGLAFSQEWAWKLRPGLDLLLVHDFFDPDQDLESGMDQRLRLGLEWVPVPGVAVAPALSSFTHEEAGASDEWLQADLQLHLFL